VTAVDQFAEFRAISDRFWQVPTGKPGQHRFLFVVRSWWQSEPTSVVLIVQAINTFTGAASSATSPATSAARPWM
jgi:hypothetical protein